MDPRPGCALDRHRRRHLRLARRRALHLRKTERGNRGGDRACACRLAPAAARAFGSQCHGYIIAAHKIEVASKVMGKSHGSAFEKGDKVKAAQVLVRLEDDEYRARLLESKGQLKCSSPSGRGGARFAARGDRQIESRCRAGSRRSAECPVTLERTRDLVRQGVLSKQASTTRKRVTTARARACHPWSGLPNWCASARARNRSTPCEHKCVRRRHARLHADAAHNTVIRAPVSAPSWSATSKRASLSPPGSSATRRQGLRRIAADLNDLQVELDINQNDFAKLAAPSPA